MGVLRRRNDYREAWETWRCVELRWVEWPLERMSCVNPEPSVSDELLARGIVCTAITGDPNALQLKFGVTGLYDPRQRFGHGSAFKLFFDSWGHLLAPDHNWMLAVGARLAELGLLDQELAKLEKEDEDRRAAGLVEYHFNLALPLEPQIRKARRDLMAAQDETFGKKNTPRPSRERWPLYLRVIDARNCEVPWIVIGKTLWPDDKSDSVKDKARRTHELAIEVRDNFPL
jgi:hypothetical protein